MLKSILEAINKREEFPYKGLEWKMEFSPRINNFVLFLKNTEGKWVAYRSVNKFVTSKGDAIKLAKSLIDSDASQSYKRIAKMWNVGL